MQYTKLKFQNNSQTLSNRMLFLCCYLTMDLFQLYRNLYVYDENRKEMYTNQYGSAIVLVLEGIFNIFLSIVAFAK